MKNLTEQKQVISPSDSRRALPVDEKVSEDKISDVLDALLICKYISKTKCKYCAFKHSGCVSALLSDARNVIEYLKSVRKKRYVSPTVTVIKGA